MLIAQVQTGDLLESKLHNGWCLITNIKIEVTSKFNGTIHTSVKYVRLKILQIATKKEYGMSMPNETKLVSLKNYKFYRDGMLLV